MLLPRLLVLLLAAGRCAAAAPLGTSGGSLEPLGRSPKTRTEPEVTHQQHHSLDRESRSLPGLDGHHRDPRHKERFIKHLTGPLYFKPKCRRHFNRLYHNTRDCTVPAYYKRCARLLTRLAHSPRCADR
uniref:ALK and LTK ligand 2 n=1 Tax=Scatophagus argus TaxID=75038 RepID=UPI001ED7FC9E|nr:ALK and LTK ligand 2 [Scatophagus argus]